LTNVQVEYVEGELFIENLHICDNFLLPVLGSAFDTPKFDTNAMFSRKN